MLIQMFVEQIALKAADRGSGIRETLVQGTKAIKSNPNISETEKFRAEKRLEDPLDTIDRMATSSQGT